MPFKQYEYRTLQTRSGATVGVGGPCLQCVHELKTPTINSASCSSSIQVCSHCYNETLYSCTLFQKLHLTNVGKVIVLDNSNPSPSCPFACLPPHMLPTAPPLQTCLHSQEQCDLCLMSHPDLRTLLMLETTVLSVFEFEDLIQAHLMPLLMSADVIIKNLHMWHIICAANTNILAESI